MPARRLLRGFTLVELLVALFVMSLVAIMSWRGLDGMVRAQQSTQQRSDQVLTLQVGLAQWNTDLNAIIQLPRVTPIEWNGRVLRMTRRSTTEPASGIVVAAWTRRVVEGRSMWLRWQSPTVSTRGDLDAAWARADVWAQSAGEAERARETAVVPLDDWQIFFYRADAWTNPLSSGVRTTTTPTPETPAPDTATTDQRATMPDGVRLVLMLPAGQAIGGQLTVDWVGPRGGGSRT